MTTWCDYCEWLLGGAVFLVTWVVSIVLVLHLYWNWNFRENEIELPLINRHGLQEDLGKISVKLSIIPKTPNEKVEVGVYIFT